MGPYKGLKQVRVVVIDCMKNIHPIYHIKTLMIKKELAKDPNLSAEDWSRFLPTFKKKNTSKRRKPLVVNEKKAYTPFPPAPVPSKIDLQLDSGEYFVNEAQREAKKKLDKRTASKQKSDENRKQRENEFIPPSEDDEEEERPREKKVKKSKRSEEEDEEVQQPEKKRKSSKK
eukprot:gene36152-44590_t